MNRMLEQWKSARKASTPIIGIQTADPAATMEVLIAQGIAATSAVVLWDVVRGWRPGNEAAKPVLRRVLADNEPVMVTGSPVESLMMAEKLPERSVLFMVHPGRYLDDTGPAGAAVMQAVWNLRDPFKANLRTVVLLGPTIKLPPELGNDVTVLDEPLPSDGDLAEIVTACAANAEVTVPPDEMTKAVDALRGLSAFAAEQATAIAVTATGVDSDVLWERKRRMVMSTPGLGIWRGGETFSDVGGNGQVKRYSSLLLKGKDSPRGVVFMDEIEKSVAGASGIGDSSGVSQGQHQQLLVWMQDSGASGMLFYGPPGAGKSAVAKAIGAEGDIPTISLDLGGMKASLVGESEQRLRTALKVIDAVTGGRALVVATCNRMAALSPELRRRFTMGTFFFDLPDAEERAAIWKIYLSRFQLPKQPLPEDEGWSGAEIRQASLLAYRLGIKLTEAAAFIVPVSKSAGEEIRQLRQQAEGKFLSSAYPGFYKVAGEDSTSTTRRPRARATSEV